MRTTVALFDGIEYIQDSRNVDRLLEGFGQFYTLDVSITPSDHVAEYPSGIVSCDVATKSKALTIHG